MFVEAHWHDRPPKRMRKLKLHFAPFALCRIPRKQREHRVALRIVIVDDCTSIRDMMEIVLSGNCAYEVIGKGVTGN